MITTWKFRIKDSSRTGRTLKRMARAVNTVWNFSKETQIQALHSRSARVIIDKKTQESVGIPNFLSSTELDALVAGSSKELGLHSQTVQAVTQEYVKKRQQFKKLLRWRGKKSLGWVPFKASAIRIQAEDITYFGHKFRYWNSRNLPDDAKIKCGSFNQDARGRWYISVTFESDKISTEKGTDEVGIDPGVKTLATVSDGSKIERPNLRQQYLKKIRRIERTRKFARRKQAKNRQYGALPGAKQVANLAAKVANARHDYLHKESTKLVGRCKTIVMGDLSCRFLNRNKKLSGISLDSGLGSFRAMLRFKADRAGATYVEVSERDSTRTCSNCGWKHPRRIGLGVRFWTCEGCLSFLDRDVNAAKNIFKVYVSESAQDVVRCPPEPRKRRRPRESPTSKHEPNASV